MQTTPESRASQFLTFFVGSDEYAINILKVREILTYQPITRVPMAPPSIRGVMNLRGQVAPVIDLPARLGLATSVPTPRTCILVIEVNVASDITTMGIVVDSVNQAIELAADDIVPPPEFGVPVDVAYLLGLGKVGSGFVLVLDVDRVLAAGELAIAASLAKGENVAGPALGGATVSAGSGSP